MQILWRYLLGRFLAAFFAALLILILTIVIVEMLRDVGEIVEREHGLAGALEYIFFRIPSFYLPYLVPASAFVATLVSLGLAARSLEFVAIRAGGISPWKALAPIFGAGIALSLIAFLLNEAVSVPAARAWAQRGQEGSELALEKGTFWYHSEPFIYNIRDVDPDREQVAGISVFELNKSGRLVRSIRAESAEQLGDGRWAFHAATVRRFDPDDPTASPKFEQASRLELELPGNLSPHQIIERVSTLSLSRLGNFVEEHERAGGNVTSARARFHTRLSEPFTVLLFVVLAIPLALRIERTRTVARSALQGVAILFFFYLLREYGSTLASRGVTPAGATAWILMALFASFGLWGLRRIPQ